MERIRKSVRKIKSLLHSRIFAVTVFSVVFCSVLYTLVLKTNVVLIRDGDREKKAITLHDQPALILKDEGIITLPVDQVEFTGFSEGDIAQIEIKRAFDVRIKADGEIHEVTMAEGSVQDALEEAGVQLQEEDLINLDPQTTLEEETEISIQRVEDRQSQETIEIPYDTQEKQSPLLKEGQVKLLRSGVPGEKICTYQETWVDGEMTSRELIGEEIVKEPVEEIVMVGAEVPVSPQTVEVDENGEPLVYESVITGATATAYSARPGAWTASGYSAVAGTVAVDPDVIPYGSKLYIATPDFSFVYGYAVAADTGTAIMDGIIDVDLFFNTYLESCLFGKRTVNIYVLETPDSKEDALPEEIGEYPLDVPQEIK